VDKKLLKTLGNANVEWMESILKQNTHFKMGSRQTFCFGCTGAPNFFLLLLFRCTSTKCRCATISRLHF